LLLTLEENFCDKGTGFGFLPKAGKANAQSTAKTEFSLEKSEKAKNIKEN